MNNCYYDNSRMIYKKAKTHKEDMRNTSISAEGTRTSLVILRFLDRSSNPMSGEHKEVWQQGGAVMNDSNREGRTKTRNIQFELCEARSWIQGRDSYLHLHFTLRHGDRRSSIGGLYAVWYRYSSWSLKCDENRGVKVDITWHKHRH